MRRATSRIAIQGKTASKALTFIHRRGRGRRGMIRWRTQLADSLGLKGGLADFVIGGTTGQKRNRAAPQDLSAPEMGCCRYFGVDYRHHISAVAQNEFDRRDFDYHFRLLFVTVSSR